LKPSSSHITGLAPTIRKQLYPRELRDPFQAEVTQSGRLSKPDSNYTEYCLHVFMERPVMIVRK